MLDKNSRQRYYDDLQARVDTIMAKGIAAGEMPSEARGITNSTVVLFCSLIEAIHVIAESSVTQAARDRADMGWGHGRADPS